MKFLSIEPLLEDIGTVDLSDINWVIVGGESGRGARPIERSWVESLLNQCRSADVPFFFKQWGGTQKKKNGRELQGRTYDEFPTAVRTPIPDRAQRHHLAAELAARLKDGQWDMPTASLQRANLLAI